MEIWRASCITSKWKQLGGGEHRKHLTPGRLSSRLLSQNIYSRRVGCWDVGRFGRSGRRARRRQAVSGPSATPTRLIDEASGPEGDAGHRKSQKGFYRAQKPLNLCIRRESITGGHNFLRGSILSNAYDSPSLDSTCRQVAESFKF